MAKQTKIFMLLSPAKTLDLSPELPAAAASLPLTLPQCPTSMTTTVATAMQKLSRSQLKTKLKLSDKLADSTYTSWQAFGQKDTAKKPCIFTYSGAAYQGLQAGTSCTTEALVYLQDRLRILTAVYGLLRPMDQIQAYRLEMGTKGIVGSASSEKLSDYWSDAVTDLLVQDMNKDGDHDQDSSILLNLASDEYAAAVNVDQLKNFFKVVFRENGRVIAVHAKRARGLMVRYLATHEIDTLEGVKAFDWEGYQYQGDEGDATSSNVLVFDRPPQSAKKTAPKPNVARKKMRHR